MIIQQIGDYKLNAIVEWIDPEMIRIKLDRSDPELDFNAMELFLTPQELARLADYINDTLAR